MTFKLGAGHKVSLAEAMESANQLEYVIGEISNGRRKPYTIPVWDIAILVQFVRGAEENSSK